MKGILNQKKLIEEKLEFHQGEVVRFMIELQRIESALARRIDQGQTPNIKRAVRYAPNGKEIKNR